MVLTSTNAKGTSIGSTANVKTPINTAKPVVMPSWARNLVSITPYIACDVLDGQLTLIAKIILESQDVALDPCIVLTNAISGYHTTSGQPYQPPNETFKVNCPLKGGEEINVYGTLLTSFTGPNYVGCDIVVSDQPPAERQRFYQVGTITASGTAAATVDGTAYNIHGSDRIVELLGNAHHEVSGATVVVFGSFKFTSNDLVRSCPMQYGFEPISGDVGDISGPHNTGIIRYEVDVPTHTSCTLQDSAIFDVAPSAAGRFITGVVFNKAGR